MTIQPVGPAAGEALGAIHRAAFDRSWDAAAFTTLLSQSGVLALARDDDGFVLVRRVLDEAEVLTLAVRPAARRRGVGAALVAAAAQLVSSAGVRALWLEVADDNAAARALYAGLGFSEQGRRRGYYARLDGVAVDALVLRRMLEGA